MSMGQDWQVCVTNTVILSFRKKKPPTTNGSTGMTDMVWFNRQLHVLHC